MATVNTVKQLVTGRLAGLKFMQRAKIREDELKKQEAEELGPAPADDSRWVLPAAALSRCKVIVEGDPKPGAVIGRMSFQNCNPAVERIAEEFHARRERIRTAAMAASGKEDKPDVSTPQASANGAEHGKVDVEEMHHVITVRKRQKIETGKVEKVTVTKTETAFRKANSFAPLRGGNNETGRHHHHHQQRGTKQVNPRTDWRNLRPPGR